MLTSRPLFGSDRKTFWDSVLGLIGHLVGSGVLFISFYLVGWAVSFVIHYLQAIHAMPDEIQNFVQRIELWWVYADAVLCAVVMVAGAVTFIREMGDMR